MTVSIPPLPDLVRLGDECLATATREGVPEAAVEKDFHLTRLIWALADRFSEGLLLKGGTCLSKVDLGYHRMSEDADLVLPWDGPLWHKGINARETNRVRNALRDLAPALGMRFPRPDGWAYQKRSHVIWDVHYDGSFPPTTITVEATMRLLRRPPRRVPLRQILAGPLARGYEDAYCWALDFDELRAEKVRAAYTRPEPEIRDYYDLELLLDAGADFNSPAFVALVDEKLAEVDRGPLANEPASFGLTPEQRAHLMGPGWKRLASVMRAGAPRFDLESMLARFDALWGKTRAE